VDRHAGTFFQSILSRLSRLVSTLSWTTPLESRLSTATTPIAILDPLHIPIRNRAVRTVSSGAKRPSPPRGSPALPSVASAQQTRRAVKRGRDGRLKPQQKLPWHQLHAKGKASGAPMVYTASANMLRPRPRPSRCCASQSHPSLREHRSRHSLKRPSSLSPRGVFRQPRRVGRALGASDGRARRVGLGWRCRGSSDRAA